MNKTANPFKSWWRLLGLALLPLLAGMAFLVTVGFSNPEIFHPVQDQHGISTVTAKMHPKDK